MKDSILIVDDNPHVLSALKRSLMDEPVNVYTASSGVEGLNILKQHKMKVVISDEMMPGIKGTELLSIVKDRYPETLRIILTGHASLEAAISGVNNGEIYRFFTKPWNEIDLKFAIRSALDKYNLEEENRRLLKTVKRQTTELKSLEKKYPGITRLERDEHGNLILPDMSDRDSFKIQPKAKRSSN